SRRLDAAFYGARHNPRVLVETSECIAATCSLAQCFHRDRAATIPYRRSQVAAANAVRGCRHRNADARRDSGGNSVVVAGSF
ncbi:hypothetical protein OAN94_08740, partial [Verrucomicrobiales bacterium]|nr:hypothetical protein [Verrucomicrobiales bacterium]